MGLKAKLRFTGRLSFFGGEGEGVGEVDSKIDGVSVKTYQFCASMCMMTHRICDKVQYMPYCL